MLTPKIEAPVRKTQGRGMGFKLYLWFLLISLVPLGLNSWYNYDAALSRQIHEANSNFQGSIALKQQLLNSFFQEKLRHLEVQSKAHENISFLQDMQSALEKSGQTPEMFVKSEQWISLTKDFGAELRSFQQSYKLADVQIINRTGTIIFSSSETRNVGQNILAGAQAQSRFGLAALKAMQNDKPIFADFELVTTQNMELLGSLIRAMVSKSGEIIGLFSIAFNSQEIEQGFLEHAGSDETGETYLVGDDGLMRTSSRFQTQSTVMRQTVDTPPIKIWKAMAGNVNNSQVGAIPGSVKTITPSGVVWENASGSSIGKIESSYLDYRGVPVFGWFLDVKILDDVGTDWLMVAEINEQEVLAPAHQLRLQSLVVFLITGGLVLLLATFLTRLITLPLQQLTRAAQAIAEGDWSARAVEKGTDELGLLAISFNHMAQSNQDRFWVQSQTAQFTEIIQKASTLEDFTQGIIRKLTPLLAGGSGALYVLDEESKQFRLLASYAYKERKSVANRFAPGEGLVGQCALEKQPILLTEVPTDHIKISTGLGESTPLTILVVPFLFQDQVLAVMEIASFHRFTPLQQTLVDTLMPTLSLGLENQKRTQRTEQLLQQTQTQAEEMTTLAEELRSQREDLQQSNDALQKKTSALQASDEELRMQQEELQTTNKQLGERAHLLERQRTDLETSQAELEEKAAELAQASRYKSEFLANMSHELRNPLNSLLIISKQFAENAEGNLTDTQIKSANIVHHSGQELLSLINDILDLAKIEAGKTDIFLEDVVVRSFATDIEQLFGHMAKNKGLVWRLEVAQELPKIIRTDRGKMGQIVKNLLSNAIKFTERGLVSLRFHPLSGEYPLGISVSDTGIGIPEDKLGLIFEAFQQADGSTTRNYGGTGLGLSISKNLAALLGGMIRVNSEPDKGSTFTLCLPMGSPESPGGTTVPSVAANGGTIQFNPHSIAAVVADDRGNITQGDQTILVIEDDSVFAGILRDIMHEKGFKCLVTADGAMGLELAAHYLPNGIILDLTLMGHLDGMATMERLKNNAATRDIPVHMVSGSDRASEGLARGAVSFLTKPVTNEQLNAVFHQIASSTSQEGCRVLIVEANPESRQTLHDLIRTQTEAITLASGGEEAFSLLKKQSFDCVILNPDLPDLKGCDLLDRINNDTHIVNPMVIIYTDKKLSRQEDTRLKAYTDSIVIKSVQSEKRLLSEIGLFLHKVEGDQGRRERQEARWAQDRETVFEGKKILVVDDDMRNTYALTNALGARGLKTEIADSGEWALKKLEQHPDINVVLMDIMMPGMDGYQTMEAIRQQERFKKLPIIAVSAKVMAEDREKCFKSGANDYLPKPVDMDRLFSLLRVWLQE